MPSESTRRRPGSWRRSFVLIPGDDSQRSRTFSFNIWLIAVLGVAAVLFLFVCSALILSLTPAGRLLGVTEEPKEDLYANQIADIQLRLANLLEEMETLRTYNGKLRRMLGEGRRVPGDSAIPPADDYPSATGHGSTKPIELDHSGFGNSESSMSFEPRGRMSIINEFPLNMPTSGYVSRGYEPSAQHYGLDLAGRSGTPVLSAAAGQVVFSDWTYDEGFVTIVSHGGGFMTMYKHNSQLLKDAGDAVRRGEVIALLGNTGRMSSGTHLHFEVRKDGVPVDPALYIFNSY